MMVRALTLVWASLLVSGGVAAADVTAGALHHTLRQQHGWMARGANPKHAWLYVASLSQNVVGIYDLEEIGVPQIGSIADGLNTPFGVVVDANGTLYVASQGAGTVTIYPAGSISPSLTLADGLTAPVGLAVDANGDVYVGNQGSAPSIQVYAQGQTSPYWTITSPLIKHPGPITFDSHRDLFVVDNDTGVAEIPFGSTQLSSLGFEGLTYPSAIAVDPGNGNVYVSDLYTDTLIFEPGTPTAVRKIKNVYPDFFGIGTVRGKTYLFGPCSPCNSVDVLTFPRRVQSSFNTVQDPQGAAVKPAGVP
jgi:hypothetical protein